MFRIIFDENIIVYIKNINSHLHNKVRPINKDETGYYFQYNKKRKEYLTPRNCVNYEEIIEKNNEEN